MIARYSRPKMLHIWSEEAQFRTWLDIEILACEGYAKIGRISPEALKTIKEKASFETDRVLQKEKETKHDVAAFISEVQNQVGDAGRFIHLGLTSSDVLDTTFAYRLKKSADLILAELENCLQITKERALKEKNIPMIGRTHGIHAEPTTMGLKWLLWYDALKRSIKRIHAAKVEISVGKLSGAVGNYQEVPPEIELHVCSHLGLKPDSLSTQVIMRDRFAQYFISLASLGSVVEMIATELRHLQRTEVSEVREGFSKGQKGSSAMPHKRNPISAENLTGIARLLRSMVIPALENCALWHERDISHSSVERVIGPDANILADYMLSRLHELLSNLEIFPERMRENLDRLQGVVFSGKILLELVKHGMPRDEAYEIVQEKSLAALDNKVPFLQLLSSDPKVTKLISQEFLTQFFQHAHTLKHLDYIYKKVLHET